MKDAAYECDLLLSTPTPFMFLLERRCESCGMTQEDCMCRQYTHGG